MEPLRVEAQIETHPIYFSMPCMIKVTISNSSNERVLIIKRLAIGYRDSLDRELFVEVFGCGAGQVISRASLLYERQPPAHSDYFWLEPGQSVSTTFNLFEWYELPGPGDYELVVSYQADDSPDGHPEELLTGIHASPRVPFSVLAG